MESDYAQAPSQAEPGPALRAGRREHEREGTARQGRRARRRGDQRRRTAQAEARRETAGAHNRPTIDG